MSVRNRTIVVLAALAALLAAPAIADAGCLATAGFPSYVSQGGIQANAGMNCTTNNGSSYTVRGYIQGNSGGWHSVNLSSPFTFSVSSPPNGYTTSRVWFMQCSFFAAADTQFRQKVTVHNNVADTTDTAFSGVNTSLPASCQ